MIRLFLSGDVTLAKDQALEPEADQARYLISVMRQKVGDELLIFNGRDGEWRAQITAMGKKTLSLTPIEQTRAQPQTGGPVLLIALIKRARLEYIVEKATELGVACIQPVITRRSNADHTNVVRLRLIAQEAAEQTERLDVPEVLEPVRLDAWLKARSEGWLIFGDEDTTHEGEVMPMLKALSGLPAGADAAILIGPEGGFDAAERETLIGLERVLRVNLGPRILRADTAAIAALTLYQAAVGDWPRNQ